MQDLALSRGSRRRDLWITPDVLYHAVHHGCPPRESRPPSRPAAGNRARRRAGGARNPPGTPTPISFRCSVRSWRPCSTTCAATPGAKEHGHREGRGDDRAALHRENVLRPQFLSRHHIVHLGVQLMIWAFDRRLPLLGIPTLAGLRRHRAGSPFQY